MTRLGVAGLGWLGESLIKDAARAPGFEVVAVQDVVPERAREIAERYAAGWCGTDYAELVDRSSVEAIVICTPNSLHAEQAQRALRAGKDVLVQKPLALSASAAARAIETAEHSGRLLFVDYTYRFLETVHVLRDALGPAPRLRRMRAAFHNIYGPGAEKRWFFDPATSGGGALTDLGVHLLDLVLWLVRPSHVGVVRADLARADPVEYAADLQLALDDVPFDLAVSWNAALPTTEISFEVETDRTRLRWENVDGSFFRFRTRRGSEVLAERETTLREDTLQAFGRALAVRSAPEIDARVYEVLDQAYGR